MRTLPSAENVRRYFYFIPLIVWFIISTILLTIPGSSFPSQNWFSYIAFDKWVHFGMFAAFTFFGCWGTFKLHRPRRSTKNWFVAWCTISIAYGVIMEYVQRDFVANRSFDSGDIVADTLGAVAGLIFSWQVFIKK